MSGIQRARGTIACTVNRAKPSKEELDAIFAESIQHDTLFLGKGLCRCNVLAGWTSV